MITVSTERSYQDCRQEQNEAAPEADLGLDLSRAGLIRSPLQLAKGHADEESGRAAIRKGGRGLRRCRNVLGGACPLG